MSPTPASASPTPVLDRQAPLPEIVRRSFRAAAVVAALLIAPACFQAVAMIWNPRLAEAEMGWLRAISTPALPSDWDGISTVLFGLMWFATLFIAIAIHEAGHAMAGAGAGFRLNSLRVGPIQFDRPFRITRYRGRGTG